MSFKQCLYLIAFAIVFLLLLFVYLNAMEVKADEPESRPRYTLVDVHISFFFANSASLPFEIIRPMCWDSAQGFCDDNLAGAEETHILIDWQNDTYGAIFETTGDECFWWQYQETFGEDNNPHINEHYWIECPVLELP